MKLEEISYLSERELRQLLGFCQPMTYTRTATVIFKGHIPHVSFLITQGTAILRDRKIEHILGKGALLALQEISLNQPMSYDIVITEGTSVVPFDRSSLTEMNQQKTATNPVLQFIMPGLAAVLKSG